MPTSFEKSYILATQYILVFCKDLKTNNYNFPEQH